MSQNELQTTLLNTLQGLIQTISEQQHTLTLQLKSYSKLEKNVVQMQNNELTSWRKLSANEMRIDELNNSVQTLLSYVSNLRAYEEALNNRAELLSTLLRSLIDSSQHLEPPVNKLIDLLKSSG